MNKTRIVTLTKDIYFCGLCYVRRFSPPFSIPRAQSRDQRHLSHETAVTWPQTGSWSRSLEVLVNTSACPRLTDTGAFICGVADRKQVGVVEEADRWDISCSVSFWAHWKLFRWSNNRRALLSGQIEPDLLSSSSLISHFFLSSGTGTYTFCSLANVSALFYWKGL